MKLYSERVNGSKPRVVEEISHSVWKGIVTIINSLENQNYFASEFPDLCPDNNGQVCGTDNDKIESTLEAYLDFQWPLVLTLPKNNSWDLEEPFTPAKEEIFDLIEFLFIKISEPNEFYFHSFFQHGHFDFDKKKGEEKFRSEINTLFRLRGLIYEMNELGQIEKIIQNETKDLITLVLSKRTNDLELNQMILDACSNIKSYDLNERYRSLEKLWDAWERLKNSYDDKKNISAEIILQKFSDNIKFQKQIECEMRELTVIGNSYRIRHSEPQQATLTNHDQLDYLFHRCLAMIDLILYRMQK